MPLFTPEITVTNTPLPVDGSGVTQPVSGPLTDAELRATAVPVSIPTPVPVTDNGGSLTVDGTVGVSGSVAVTGPLTDAELRATPVPVSTTPMTVGSASVTRVPVSTTVTTLRAANANRIKLIVVNESGTLYVKLGSDATSTDYSYVMTAGSTLEISVYTGIVTGVKSNGSTNAQVTEL